MMVVIVNWLSLGKYTVAPIWKYMADHQIQTQIVAIQIQTRCHLLILYQGTHTPDLFSL